ncbi:MAG: glycosyltransferase family 2 protein [Saprospiraceae bacterium]|nr:glycosyltransferase family 2 protein [Saprospiraceae bacterium]
MGISPVYNEGDTIYQILSVITSVNLTSGGCIELIVIDDCSSDHTQEEIQRFISDRNSSIVRALRHPVNQGKGSAIRTGIARAQGEYIIIQDADLEYDPHEYNLLLQPILSGRADVVYGSRFMGSNPHRVLFFDHSIGNKFLTFVSNLFTNINLTDMETCYKLFKADIIKKIHLKENRFGFEPEVTAKIARIKGIRIYEVGISYYGRTYEEGKKIGWRDGFRALWCILWYNL